MRKAFTASVYARNEGKILLILHKRFKLWVPPGGELEENESPIEAAARELREETGLEAEFPQDIPEHLIPGRPPALMMYEEHAGPPEKGWHMNFAFRAEVPHRNVTPNNEFKEYGWFTGEEDILRALAPKNVIFLTRMAALAPRSVTLKGMPPTFQDQEP